MQHAFAVILKKSLVIDVLYFAHATFYILLVDCYYKFSKYKYFAFSLKLPDSSTDQDKVTKIGTEWYSDLAFSGFKVTPSLPGFTFW